MKIVADENIPLLANFFGEIGDITCIPGREICSDDLKDADILIVRSVTTVNEALLADSKVKFVGSCTIGFDHVDLDYLRNKGISFANAPGCNANSVVEYVLSCLSVLTESHGFDFEKHRVGIVGFGNVGSLLAKRLRKLNVDFAACDPLLEQQDELGLVTLDEVLKSDVVTLHVPLTHDGPHPTFKMFDTQLLDQFSAEQVLINTSRGNVVNGEALLQKLHKQPDFKVILDVWENEPLVDVELAQRVHFGTPHIAGYSLDGKAVGTEMVYRALCTYLGLPSRHKAGQFLDEPPLSKMTFTSMANVDWCIHTAIRACYDVRHDHSQLQSTLRSSNEERAAAFDSLRKNYRCRREFSGVKVQLKQVDSELHKKFKALGFNIKL